MKKLIFAILLLCFTSCTGEFHDVVVMDVPAPESLDAGVEAPGEVPEEPVCEHALQWTGEATYVDDRGRGYDAYVEFEAMSDVARLSAYEAAELAYLTTLAHEFLKLDNPDAVYEILSSGHWLVMANNDRFNNTYDTMTADPNDPLAENIAAVIWIKGWLLCYDTPEEAEWSSMIRSMWWDRTNVNVVVHEMVHAVSYATYGDSDPGHLREDMWSKYQEDSVQAVAVKLHDSIYFPFSF